LLYPPPTAAAALVTPQRLVYYPSISSPFSLVNNNHRSAATSPVSTFSFISSSPSVVPNHPPTGTEIPSPPKTASIIMSSTNQPGGGSSSSAFPVEDVLIPQQHTKKTTTTRNNKTVLVRSPELLMWQHKIQLRKFLSALCLINPSSWMKLAQVLEGRDNITKLLQYLSRFGAWYYQSLVLHGQRDYSILAVRLTNLKASLSHARKAFRLGRTFMELEKLYQLGLWDRLVKNMLWSEGKLSNENNDETNHNLSHMVWNAVRLCGMAGFWTADNMAFIVASALAGGGHQTPNSDRDQWVARCNRIANRSYFVAALTNLYLNGMAYWQQRRKIVEQLQLQQQQQEQPPPSSNDRDEGDNKNDDDDDAEADRLLLLEMKTLTTHRSSVIVNKSIDAQFDLFLALSKSICDVLMFSNNPGVDLWQRHTGRKLPEGLHAVCGIMSAATLLVKNFPTTTTP
jgi:Peroxisomal biogenesis factor 11 (PEX11)